ncbi:phosphopantothenate--cysteine ligase [Schistocerca cancellata]|uniref:phosphopantothenate--cysteine ligase n=1 Tax=Schistocerca cancellata TaxID=274614 RepID=UPI002118659C|nr:phosphopantothenate--cysteine ligase [Schistocerca cancellata]
MGDKVEGVDTCDEFFATNPKPSDYDKQSKRMKDFCQHHTNLKTKIVLITSGGTTVPLEQNTVRFVDNFSAGTRGASSAEYFLKSGYAVIFLYRSGSLEPFTRHFPGHTLLDALDISYEGENTNIAVRTEVIPKLLPVLQDYHNAIESNRFLGVQFKTLSDYAWLVHAACDAVQPLGNRVMLYMAAAVADFYVPAKEMPEHKIQSSGGSPKIQLRVAPKILREVATKWAVSTYIVSFKLETDEGLLVPKAKNALERYKHKMVIGNILNTRKYRVLIITPDSEKEILLSPEEQSAGVEIESKIVAVLADKHSAHIESVADS